MKLKKYSTVTLALVALIGLSVALPASAQTNDSSQTTPGMHTPNGTWGQRGGNGMMRPVVVGTVTSVNGTMITISGRQGFGTTTAVTNFTIDATNAKILKSNTISTISSIANGDTLIVQGTINGSSVTATMIRDGQIPVRGTGMMGGEKDTHGNTINPITGDGKPVIAGTVTSINGNNLTITNKSNTSYTVDITSAKILQGGTTINSSSISVGDNVILQGTINGTAITATSVIDQHQNSAPGTSTTNTQVQGNRPAPGFFGKVWQSFTHLFGF